MDRRTLRDWVHRFNCDPERNRDRRTGRVRPAKIKRTPGIVGPTSAPTGFVLGRTLLRI